MSIREHTYYQVTSDTLSRWLENQSDHSMWSVDGDPILTGLMNFPCLASDLANEIQRLNKSLLVYADSPLPNHDLGQGLSVDDLDCIAIREEGNRVFQFCWEQGSPEIDWLMIEDQESGQFHAEMGAKESMDASSSY